MTRSPLFYPMHRADADAGGAADLQTDIMRFMAILALCLMAVFALVQSIPLVPQPAPQLQAAAPSPPVTPAQREAAVEKPPVTPVRKATPPAPEPVPEHVALQRPRKALPVAAPTAPPPPEPARPTAREGFTLRFESDLALTRLVAAGQVGFYALGDGRAQRMTVSQSRISFWDASAPNAFHEMEATTVPDAVLDALARTGADADTIDWGVTLPGKLRRQLDALLREHTGGALVIGADGNLMLEPT